MRIALLGLGELILRIADHFHAHPEHHVAAVARARRPVPEGAALLEDWAAAQGVPTVGHHRELPSDLDLVLCARYGRILRRPFLTRQRRVLNLPLWTAARVPGHPHHRLGAAPTESRPTASPCTK